MANAATTEARAAVIREIFWQPLRIADHDKAREALDELLEDLATLRAAWNAHMETCPPVGRPEIAQASWDDLERWRNAPSGTASA